MEVDVMATGREAVLAACSTTAPRCTWHTPGPVSGWIVMLVFLCESFEVLKCYLSPGVVE